MRTIHSDTGERVFVKMNFYDYRVDLTQNAGEVTIVTEDDWYQPEWFEISELPTINLSSATCNTLVMAEIIEEQQL